MVIYMAFCIGIMKQNKHKMERSTCLYQLIFTYIVVCFVELFFFSKMFLPLTIITSDINRLVCTCAYNYLLIGIISRLQPSMKFVLKPLLTYHPDSSISSSGFVLYFSRYYNLLYELNHHVAVQIHELLNDEEELC